MKTFLIALGFQKHEAEILDLLFLRHELSSKDIEQELKISQPNAAGYLKNLRSSGLITQHVRPGIRTRCYYSLRSEGIIKLCKRGDLLIKSFLTDLHLICEYENKLFKEVKTKNE